ncbi:MAG: type ISP restriction/modification enzyme [Spirochaetota bacterium]
MENQISLLKIPIKSIFEKFATDCKIEHPEISIDFSKKSLVYKLRDIQKQSFSNKYLREKFQLSNYSESKFEKVRCIIQKEKHIAKYIYSISHGFMDERYIYTHQELEFSASKISQATQGISLIIQEQNATEAFSAYVSPSNVIFCKQEQNNVYSYPLYSQEQVNIKQDCIAALAKHTKFTFSTEEEKEIIFYYIYALCQIDSPTFVNKESLIPFISDREYFSKVANIGKNFLHAHLLKTQLDVNTDFHILGNGQISKAKFMPNGTNSQTGKLMLNHDQCFSNVNQSVWDFSKLGIPVLQSWLQSREHLTLDTSTMATLQRMISAIEYHLNTKSSLEKLLHQLELFKN